MEFNREQIVAAFLAESEEGLALLEQHVVAAEAGPADAELLNDIFRVAHTLKGNACALGFSELTGFAHTLEDLLDAIRRGKIALSRNIPSLVLQAVDVLRTLVPAASGGQDRLTPPQRDLKESIARQVRDADSNPELTAEQTECVPAIPTPHGESRNHTLRVDVTKLDRMLNLTGEIAIAQGRLRRMIEEAGGEAGRDLLEKHREAERLFKDLQEQVMSTCMVPIGPLFQQFVRSVRDMSHTHGKLARLEVIGGDVEVDTRVLEHLKDPLLHMIRNAVDHGIESPGERQNSGKNPCGVLRLAALHSSGYILIQLSDDGRGFSRERILARARAMGLSKSEEGPSDQEIFRLVFQPGFSTADKITDLSGRGVGMDVVRRNIDELRGTIEIQSHEGEGTTITIRLPLTLAIIDGFSVKAGEETYVIPLEMIRECLQMPGDQISSAPSGVVSLRGKPLAYVRLREVLGQKPGAIPARENIVVVQYDGTPAGLAVDELLGESQAILKPLGRLFRHVDGISASTILGDGCVALFLDVGALLRHTITKQLPAVY